MKSGGRLQPSSGRRRARRPQRGVALALLRGPRHDRRSEPPDGDQTSTEAQRELLISRRPGWMGDNAAPWHGPGAPEGKSSGQLMNRATADGGWGELEVRGAGRPRISGRRFKKFHPGTRGWTDSKAAAFPEGFQVVVVGAGERGGGGGGGGGGWGPWRWASSSSCWGIPYVIPGTAWPEGGGTWSVKPRTPTSAVDTISIQLTEFAFERNYPRGANNYRPGGAEGPPHPQTTSPREVTAVRESSSSAAM